MAEWFTVEDGERLLAAWPDAPILNLEVCGMILSTAREQVIAYAPAPTREESELSVDGGYITVTDVIWDVEHPPENYAYAQLQQATNLWNAGTVSSAGDQGVETFSFTPRPLDKTIRQLIRPIDGKPDVY